MTVFGLPVSTFNFVNMYLYGKVQSGEIFSGYMPKTGIELTTSNTAVQLISHTATSALC